MNTNFGKKIGKGAIVAVIMVFIISSFAAASPWGDKGRGEGRGDGFGQEGRGKSFCGIWRSPKIVEELELTDEQVKGLKDADFAGREKRMELKCQLDKLRLQMEKAFSAAAVDEAAVRQLAAKISDLRGEMFTQKIESRLEVRKLLNADQLKKLKTLKFQFKNKHAKKGGKGKHHGGMRGNDDMN